MKNCIGMVLVSAAGMTLAEELTFDFEASIERLYGQLNTMAPKETSDFKDLIGESTCQSIKRIDQKTWAEPEPMIWRFKYIMNGMAVQDETLKRDGVHSGSIRQFDSESNQWQVHYYSVGSTKGSLKHWVGGRVEDNLVFNREQAAPNGMPGVFRLTFSDITAFGFEWVGAWVSEDEKIVYPTWRISCKRK